MSHTLRNTNALERGIDDHLYPPPLASTQETQGEPQFIDGSGPIFSMYLEMAMEEDKKMVEGWKADADGILIFTGLFSAAVASLISVSIQDIRPNPQDTSNFYLANIYQAIADPNRLNISLPSPPQFSPPNYAIWVNSLWFLSLTISLTCALLATLLQQWARRYLKVTQPRYGPHKRARIRAFFFEGVEKFFLPWSVEALPTLLHASLFLFFAGLVTFLSNVDLTIFKLVLPWACVCMVLYGSITLIPIFRHDSPYSTPLTSLVWPIIIGILFVVDGIPRWYTQLVNFYRGGSRQTPRYGEKSYRAQLVQGMQKTVEETALNAPPEIDTRAFLWTLDSLGEDHERERFFSGLPGFRSSKVVHDPFPRLTEEQIWKLCQAVIGLFDRTFSSDLLPEHVKHRRAVICARAIDPAHIPQAYLGRIMSEDQYGPVQSAGIARLVRGWDNRKDVHMTGLISAIVSSVVARAQRRDDQWFAIASDELLIPGSVLRDYAARGDNLSLTIFIHIIRRQFDNFWKPSWPRIEFSRVLETASRSDVQDTTPELQHEFCALWNQIVLKAQNEDDRALALYIIRRIRNVYVALHQGTDSAPTRFSATTRNWEGILGQPSSYPVCKVAGHIHDNSASTTFSRTATLVPASLSSPDAPSSRVPSLHHIDESLTNVPSVDNSYPVHQTTIESLRTPVTSPDLATAGAIRNIVTSSTTTPRATPETSTSAPLSSIHPPTPISIRHNTDFLTPSDTPNLPRSVSNPVLHTESHRLITVNTTPNAPPRPTSTSDLAAVTEDDGGPEPGSCKGEDALDPPSVNRATCTNM